MTEGTEQKMVIPEAMFPRAETKEVLGKDGKKYLVRNEAMLTGMQHSAGEHSRLFLALRDECKIIGHNCPSCGQTICPPFQKRCPECNFVEMTDVTMSDIGFMAASPVIVFFAPSRFKDHAPFANGYVFLLNSDGTYLCDTAIPIRCKTTRGVIRPGVFKKDMLVKVVFKDKRDGSPLDIFLIPKDELTQEQWEKTPLLESDLSWDTSQCPHLLWTQQFEKSFEDFVELLEYLPERVLRSPRARSDLSNWSRIVHFKTGVGDVSAHILNGRLFVLSNFTKNVNLVIAIEDPSFLVMWMRDGLALSNLIMEGTAWINTPDVETITRLDRLFRSLRRDGV